MDSNNAMTDTPVPDWALRIDPDASNWSPPRPEDDELIRGWRHHSQGNPIDPDTLLDELSSSVKDAGAVLNALTEAGGVIDGQDAMLTATGLSDSNLIESVDRLRRCELVEVEAIHSGRGHVDRYRIVHAYDNNSRFLTFPVQIDLLRRTHRQREAVVRELARQGGDCDSLLDLRTAAGLSQTELWDALKALQAEGYLTMRQSACGVCDERRTTVTLSAATSDQYVQSKICPLDYAFLDGLLSSGDIEPLYPSR